MLAWNGLTKKYDPAILDGKLSINVQDIQQSHKIHPGIREK